MKKEKDTPQTRKEFIMKKATLQYLVNIMNDNINLNGVDTEDDAKYVAARDELVAELNRGADAKAKNAEAYEGIHDLVIGALSDIPATCAEIFEQIETELPSGMGKGKVQYALTHLWQDEIVKIEGKPNTYRRA